MGLKILRLRPHLNKKIFIKFSVQMEPLPQIH